MKAKGAAVVLGALLGGAGLLAFGACDDAGSYPFRARPLDGARRCLGPTAVLDVLSGADPGLGCTPRCFVATQPDEAGALTVYGSTACGRAPGGYDTTGLDPRCAVVLAAVGRTDLCTDDGGQTVPPVVDGGSDSGDASDASADVFFTE